LGVLIFSGENKRKSSEKEMSVPRCPSCGETLPEIIGYNVYATASYAFSKKRGKYILYTSVMDIERFNCPKCNSEIPNEWLNNHEDKSLVAVQPSGLYKPFIIDLQELPFNTKYAEFYESLPQTFTIKNDEKDSSEKEEKKEAKKK